jgi:hypothetical protein
MLNIKKSEPKYTISQLVVELLYSAPVAHIEHLKTTNFAQHKALNKYYDGIPDLTDSIIEEYQGLYGIQTFKEPMIKSSNFVEHLTKLYDYSTNAQSSCDCSNVINRIDEVKSLISSTLYKLKNLK